MCSLVSLFLEISFPTKVATLLLRFSKNSSIAEESPTCAFPFNSQSNGQVGKFVHTFKIALVQLKRRKLSFRYFPLVIVALRCRTAPFSQVFSLVDDNTIDINFLTLSNIV